MRLAPQKPNFGKMVGGLLIWVGVLTYGAVAAQPRSREIAKKAAQSEAPAGGPTFARDIAPIIYSHCSGCHHQSAAGGMDAPFALTSYSEAKRFASGIAAATRTRAMPPWLPEAGYGDFAENARLTDAEIRLIGEWVQEGAPEGPQADEPEPPKFDEGWQLGKPDLVITAPRALTVPASGPDIFWNFIFTPPIKTKRYVRAIEVRPGGDLAAIHHANVILDPAESARSLEKEPGTGFPGMDLPLKRSPFYVPSDFLFWKPGNTPWVEPKGLAWELDPGTDLVLNAHFMTMGAPEIAKPSIGLYFSDKPPTQFPMLIELENDDALDIPAGDRDFLVSDDFRLPQDVTVLAVYPHAHYLGHLLEGYATLPNGQRKWLIRIPSWDFTWQAVYHYRNPVFLPRGTVISMRFHYDNSAANPRNPHQPPRRVLGGNESTDEMAHLWLQILPRDEGAGRVGIEEALLEQRVEKFSDDFGARLDLGDLLLAQANAAEAAGVLEQAVHLEPKQEGVHRLLAAALDRVGRLRDAIGEYRAALSIKPGDNDTRYSLACGLVRAGNFRDALQEFANVASAEPRNADIRGDFGELLMRHRRPADALKEFEAALAIDPSRKDIVEAREQALAQEQSQ